MPSGPWPLSLMLRTGSVVVRRETRTSASSSSTARVVSETEHGHGLAGDASSEGDLLADPVPCMPCITLNAPKSADAYLYANPVAVPHAAYGRSGRFQAHAVACHAEAGSLESFQTKP